MKQKVLNYISFLTLLIAFLLSGLITFWLVFPYKVLVLNSTPFPVSEKRVRPGETLAYTVDYCKYMNIEVFISRTFNDQINFGVPGIINNREKGCHKVNFEIQIPKTLPSSTYTLDLVYRYKVNPLRTIEYNVKTEPFEVIK